MQIIKDIVISIVSYPKAFFVGITQWKYLLLLLLSIMLFIIPIFMIGSTTQYLSKLIPYIDNQKYVSMGVSLLSSIAGFILLMFLSPVFSLVADSVNSRITGESHPFSVLQLIKDIVRAIKIALRNLVFQYFIIAILLLLFSFFDEVKALEILGEALIILVTSYFYGFVLLDYAMEIKRMNYRSSVAYIRSHIGLAIGLGSIYYLMITINDIPLVESYLGNINLYWSVFSEAIVAFIGVIAAVIVINSTKSNI